MIAPDPRALKKTIVCGYRVNKWGPDADGWYFSQLADWHKFVVMRRSAFMRDLEMMRCLRGIRAEGYLDDNIGGHRK